MLESMDSPSEQHDGDFAASQRQGSANSGSQRHGSLVPASQRQGSTNSGTQRRGSAMPGGLRQGSVIERSQRQRGSVVADIIIPENLIRASRSGSVIAHDIPAREEKHGSQGTVPRQGSIFARGQRQRSSVVADITIPENLIRASRSGSVIAHDIPVREEKPGSQGTVPRQGSIFARNQRQRSSVVADITIPENLIRASRSGSVIARDIPVREEKYGSQGTVPGQQRLDSIPDEVTPGPTEKSGSVFFPEPQPPKPAYLQGEPKADSPTLPLSGKEPNAKKRLQRPENLFQSLSGYSMGFGSQGVAGPDAPASEKDDPDACPRTVGRTVGFADPPRAVEDEEPDPHDRTAPQTVHIVEPNDRIRPSVSGAGRTGSKSRLQSIAASIAHPFDSRRNSRRPSRRFSKLRKTSIYDVYEKAKKKGVEIKREPWAQATFEYTFYLILLSVVYFVLVGRPLWGGAVYWLYIAVKTKFNVMAGFVIVLGFAVAYAFLPLFLLFEKDPPPVADNAGPESAIPDNANPVEDNQPPGAATIGPESERSTSSGSGSVATAPSQPDKPTVQAGTEPGALQSDSAGFGTATASTQEDADLDTALLIPCYKSAGIIGATLEAALKVFPASHIFVIANGNSPTPLDNTEEVCIPYGVNHIWSPVGSKIVAQFVGCYAAKSFKNVLLIDDDCLIPANFPIVSDRLVGRVKSIGYMIKSVGPNRSLGNWCQQAQDMEYKISGLQRAFAGICGSATFPHGAISLWDRDFLIKVFHDHPGFSISEDWFFGHSCRRLGGRIKMCSAVFVETETPPAVFFSSSGSSRGGFGEMTVFKQRFTRWNFFFVTGIYYNMHYVLCSWKLGWWEIGAKLAVIQEVYETLLYLFTPFILPMSIAVNPAFWGYILVGTMGLYFLNVVIFNEIHLRLKKERVAWSVLTFYYTFYKVIFTFVNVASCYWSIYKYARYFAERYPKVVEDEKVVEVVLRMEEAAYVEGLEGLDEDVPFVPPPTELGGRRFTVTVIPPKMEV